MDLDDLYRLLRADHARLQNIVDTVPEPMLVLDENLRVKVASRAFYDTFRVDRFETVDRLIYELGDGAWNIPDLRLLLENVIPKSSVVIDYTVEQDFPGLGPRKMMVTARTLQGSNKSSRSMLLVITDATDRPVQQTADHLLFGELKHRVKNLFAVIQSIARMSPTEGRSARDFRDEFLGRFTNLVRSFSAAYEAGSGGSLRTMIETSLSPFGGPDRFSITGAEDIDPSSGTIVSLSLVLYELATNAVKYGALSAPGGTIAVTWQLDTSRNSLCLQWVERGGPEVTPPQHQGYGTKLISTLVSHNLRGKLEQIFAVEGYSIKAFIPLDAAVGQPAKVGVHHENGLGG